MPDCTVVVKTCVQLRPPSRERTTSVRVEPPETTSNATNTFLPLLGSTAIANPEPRRSAPKHVGAPGQPVVELNGKVTFPDALTPLIPRALNANVPLSSRTMMTFPGKFGTLPLFQRKNAAYTMLPSLLAARRIGGPSCPAPGVTRSITTLVHVSPLSVEARTLAVLPGNRLRSLKPTYTRSVPATRVVTTHGWSGILLRGV